MLSEVSYPRKSLRHLVAYRNMAGTAWNFVVDGNDSGCRGVRPDFSSCSRLSNAQDEESRPISLGEIGKCVSYSDPLVRVQVILRVDLAELREVPGPPPLRIRERPGFGCQRVNRL
jgi:hypothetical protein